MGSVGGDARSGHAVSGLFLLCPHLQDLNEVGFRDALSPCIATAFCEHFLVIFGEAAVPLGPAHLWQGQATDFGKKHPWVEHSETPSLTAIPGTVPSMNKFETSILPPPPQECSCRGLCTYTFVGGRVQNMGS